MILRIITTTERHVDLKAKRKKANLTQKELASLAGITRIYLNKLENGVHACSEVTWNRLKEFL